MTTMEDVIDSESRQIIKICTESTVHSNLIMAMSDIKRLAENIIQTLEEGDPE